MNEPTLRIGTRTSVLAMAQARIVADQIAASLPEIKIEIVGLVTKGDRLAGPLTEIGGKGLFTQELESALRDGSIDMAVHSAKDLPVDQTVAIAAVPRRGDPRDALVSRGGLDFSQLPQGATVGTSSFRRSAQCLMMRGDLRIAPLRGNVETRLQKALNGEMDAVILAAAGLERSGLLKANAQHIRILEPESFVPAAGQGALAVQIAQASDIASRASSVLDDPESRRSLEAERMVVAQLGASCRSSIGVLIQRIAGQWRGLAMVSRPDGGDMIRTGSEASSAHDVAQLLLDDLLERNAAELLR